MSKIYNKNTVHLPVMIMTMISVIYSASFAGIVYIKKILFVSHYICINIVSVLNLLCLPALTLRGECMRRETKRVHSQHLDYQIWHMDKLYVCMHGYRHNIYMERETFPLDPSLL